MKMIKYCCLFILLITDNHVVEAQNLKEWFVQQKTQIEYLVSHNAALRVFNTTIRKGYQEKGFGLGLINSDLNSEYGMHLTHYRDFEALPLTEQERVKTELELHLERLDRLYINVQSMLNRSSIPPSLRQGLNRLLLGIRKVYLQKKSEAEILLGKGELEMNDAERLERIEELYAALGSIEKDIQRLVQIHEGILAFQQSEQSAIRQTKTLYP